MAYRKIDNLEGEILNAVIKIGAKDGARHTTARKIAAMCGISTYAIFDHFGTKQAYLDAAAESIDTPLMELVIKHSEEGKTVEDIWDFFFEYFRNHPEQALYYISYINTIGFDPTPNNPRSNLFLSVAKKFFRPKHEISDEEYLLMWDYITTMSFYYTEKIIKGFMVFTPETEKMIKDIVFKGIDNI